jgi:hypothetical protein
VVHALSRSPKNVSNPKLLHAEMELEGANYEMVW